MAVWEPGVEMRSVRFSLRKSVGGIRGLVALSSFSCTSDGVVGVLKSPGGKGLVSYTYHSGGGVMSRFIPIENGTPLPLVFFGAVGDLAQRIRDYQERIG